MAIAFPNTSGDFSLGSNSSGFNLSPPTNTANGDLLIAVTSGRDSAITTPIPSGWTAVVTNFQSNGAFGTIGETNVYYMTVPTASALPSSWTWDNTEARWSVMILRATGVNLTNPITATGTFTDTGSNDFVNVGSIASGGAAFMSGTSYLSEYDVAPANATLNGWNLLQNYGLTSAQAGRQACVTYGGPDNGGGSTTAFTLNLASGGQWYLEAQVSPTQAAIIVVGLNAAPASVSGLLATGVV